MNVDVAAKQVATQVADHHLLGDYARGEAWCTCGAWIWRRPDPADVVDLLIYDLEGLDRTRRWPAHLLNVAFTQTVIAVTDYLAAEAVRAFLALTVAARN